jgi:choline dehydrogenase
VIVVGAGSAGAVIAARATENAACEVTLVEAGPDYADTASLPRDLVDGRRNSMRAHDWGFAHRPTPGQVLFDFPRGKVVGGSSAVNTCIALRGQPADYDEWASLGLPDWSWDECLPAFKRIEDDRDFANEHHGGGGPIPIRRHPPSELVPWQAAFVERCRALGFPACTDTNDPTQTGVGPHAMNKIDGVRMSAARCYLDAAVRRRDNLRIVARTLVRRVLFENRRVCGLEVEAGDTVRTMRASRVVLCGGAVATPAILLRSGVGPRDVVRRLGVELVADVPAVGAKILDHPGAAIFLRPRRGVIDFAHPLIQTVLRYTSRGSDVPNDMLVQPGSIVPLPRFALPLVSVMCQVGKPRGVGRFWLTSASPRARPRIESDFMLDAQDRERALDALELAWRIASAPPMSELATPIWPWRSVVERREGLARWLRRICGSGYHPCGTVPMGAERDASGAVDGRGRVRGVEGLFVADASIMPTIPSANTNLASLMIGERFGAWFRDGAI